jgi:hypothetical protein
VGERLRGWITGLWDARLFILFCFLLVKAVGWEWRMGHDLLSDGYVRMDSRHLVIGEKREREREGNPFLVNRYSALVVYHLCHSEFSRSQGSATSLSPNNKPPRSMSACCMLHSRSTSTHQELSSTYVETHPPFLLTSTPQTLTARANENDQNISTHTHTVCKSNVFHRTNARTHTHTFTHQFQYGVSK